MSWTVEIVRDEDKYRLKVSYSEYEADMNHMISTEANRFANQLLIAAAECAKLNSPPKKFFR